MEGLLIFVLGVAAVVASWFWLYRTGERDLEALGRQLGLSRPAQRTRERIQRRGALWQIKELEGTFNGHPLQIWTRSMRGRGSRQTGSIFTMVVRPVATDANLPLILVEPRLGGRVLDWFYGGMPEVKLWDGEFQSSFRVTSADSSWAARLFDAQVRAAILDLRQRWIGGQGNVLVSLADASAFGWIEIDAQRIAFLIPGTPMPSLAAKITDAAAVLEQIARRV